MENKVKQEQLDGLVPMEIEVKLTGGRVIKVGPVKFGKFGDMIEAAQPLIEFFEQDFKQKSNGAAPVLTADAIPASWANINMIDIIKKMPHVIRQVVKAGVDDSVDLDQLYVDDGIRLAKAVIEVNVDFFTQHVLPAITLAVTELSESLPGSITHNASSLTVTPLKQ